MQAGGRKADQSIAGPNGRPRDNRFARHRPHDRADQVILARRIQSRHFGGFAANESALVFTARFAQPPHHGFKNRPLKAGRAEIVQEKQRPVPRPGRR